VTLSMAEKVDYYEDVPSPIDKEEDRTNSRRERKIPVGGGNVHSVRYSYRVQA